MRGFSKKRTPLVVFLNVFLNGLEEETKLIGFGQDMPGAGHFEKSISSISPSKLII